MLQPGTLTSTSLGRVRVSSAVSAITSPPGSPPERHYTQVPRVLPPEHARPRPNPPRDTPPRTPVSPPPCPCWRPTPPHPPLSEQHPYTEGPTIRGLSYRAVPRRLSRAFGSFLRAPVRLLELSHKLALPRLAHGFGAADDLPDGLVPFLEVLREGEPGSEDRLAQSPRTRGPPRTAARARRFPYRAPQRVRARRRPSLRRNSATTPVGTGLNRRIWARERIVGSTPSREVASSTKTVSPSGSSSVLSSAFAACTFSVSALKDEYPARTLERPARRQTHYLPHLPDSRERPLGHYLRQIRMQSPERPVFRRPVASGDQRGPEPQRHHPLAHAGRTVEQVRLRDFTGLQSPPE